MKILVYSHGFKRGGAAIILLRLLRELRSRHTIHVLSIDDRDNEPLVDEYRRLGIPIVPGAITRDYDVFLINSIVGSRHVLYARDKGCPVLWWIHEPEMGLKYLEQDRADPAAFAAADRIIFPTLWQARKVYARYITRDNWGVVPAGAGIDTTAQPAPFAREPGRFYLAQLGWIGRRKGQDLSVRALNRLSNPNITLFLVGDYLAKQDFREDLERMAGPNVVFTGSQPEAVVSGYLQHCDAVVFPTRDDLIPLAILEGLAFGRCVLSSDFGPIPETIRHGLTGLLSPVNDYQVLAGNIRMVYEDRELLRRLGRAGKRILQARHGFTEHVARMERELERIAR